MHLLPLGTEVIVCYRLICDFSSVFGTSFSSQISRPLKSYFEATVINLAYIFGKISQLSLHSYQIIVNFHSLRVQTNAMKTFVLKSFLPLSHHTAIDGQNKRRQLYSTSGKILVLLKSRDNVVQIPASHQNIDFSMFCFAVWEERTSPNWYLQFVNW